MNNKAKKEYIIKAGEEIIVCLYNSIPHEGLDNLKRGSILEYMIKWDNYGLIYVTLPLFFSSVNEYMYVYSLIITATSIFKFYLYHQLYSDGQGRYYYCAELPPFIFDKNEYNLVTANQKSVIFSMWLILSG